MGAPLFMIAAIVFCIMVSKIFDMVGLGPLAGIFSTISTSNFCLLVAYLFSRYSGNYPEFVAKVDEYCEMLWVHLSNTLIAHMPLDPALAASTAAATLPAR